MEANDRKIASDGQQCDAGPMPPEMRIELQRACQDLGAQKRPRTVADDHDLLSIAVARGLDKMLREAVDALVPFRTPAMGEFPGPDRVSQQIKHIGALFRVFQHRARQGRKQCRCGCNAESAGYSKGVESPSEYSRYGCRQHCFHK